MPVGHEYPPVLGDSYRHGAEFLPADPPHEEAEIHQALLRLAGDDGGVLAGDAEADLGVTALKTGHEIRQGAKSLALHGCQVDVAGDIIAVV